jgi:hypothetical protein
MAPVRDFVNGLLRPAARGGGVVMDGRDIGTVVFPDAEVKVFMVADPEERARRRLLELELLRAMRFDATLPDGNKISVDGFLAIDEEKLGALPEATVFDLHRTGVLSLIHAHQISLGLMRALVERRLARRATA